MRFSLGESSEKISSCFSEDLKFAYLLEPSDGHCIYVDLVNKTCENRVLLCDYIRYHSPARLLCSKGILVIVTSAFVEIFDLEECKSLQCIRSPYFAGTSQLISKLSPNGNILAVPTMTGDMDFFQIFHTGSS